MVSATATLPQQQMKTATKEYNNNKKRKKKKKKEKRKKIKLKQIKSIEWTMIAVTFCFFTSKVRWYAPVNYIYKYYIQYWTYPHISHISQLNIQYYLLKWNVEKTTQFFLMAYGLITHTPYERVFFFLLLLLSAILYHVHHTNLLSDFK